MTHTPAPQTITDRITQHAQSVALAEQEAREIDNLMRTVPGMPAGYLQQGRRVGQLRNPWADGNMTTQQALLAWPDPAIKNLCTYLADKAGKPLPAPDYARIAEEERAKEEEARMIAWVQEQRRLREEAPPPNFNGVQLNLGYGPGAQADLLEGPQRRESERAF